jgi:CheY-like chemotaxis protein
VNKKIKLLVVEDEYLVAFHLQEQLRQLDYEVGQLVATGEEAIKNVEQEQPDIILMDMGLAGEMDGVETAREIRTRFAIPIIFLTGYAGDKIKERIKGLTSATYLVKPVTLPEIEAAIALVMP